MGVEIKISVSAEITRQPARTGHMRPEPEPSPWRAPTCVPKRLKTVEAALVGKARNEETADMAGKMAVEGAQTLRHNAYKVPLARNVIVRTLAELV